MDIVQQGLFGEFKRRIAEAIEILFMVVRIGQLQPKFCLDNLRLRVFTQIQTVAQRILPFLSVEYRHRAFHRIRLIVLYLELEVHDDCLLSDYRMLRLVSGL